VSNPQRFAELVQRLDLTPKRVLEWIEISRKIWIPTAPDTDLIEQFEGFFDLEDIDLDSYEPRLLSMQVILGIEGANQRQVLKQADVLMLFYLLRQGALVTHTDLDHLEFVEDRALRNFQDARILQTNWNYYAPRTDHTYGSSLSPAIHAVLACELGKPQEAYQHFIRSALVDLADVRGNAAEGVHAASAGGVWQAVVFGFGGVHLTPQGPIANPTLPEGWTRLKFQLNWQGNTYAFDLRSPSEPPARAAERPELAAVIFDLDGVITDTSEFHYQGWKRLADEIGIPFDREQNEALRGVSRKDSLRRLLQGRSVPDDQFQEMMDRKNRYYLELIHTITPADLLPGVADLLADLKAAGIKIALGSSSKNAPEVLERLGIMDYMEAIADGNNVTQSKPAPDVFLYAAEQLGIPAIHCIVVEDAASGIEAAIRAGMWSVGLGPLERVKDAHLVLPNLEGVHWSDLRDRLLQITQPSQPEPSIQHLVQLQKANKARQRV
jgi:kojibiose phosphorylase